MAGGLQGLKITTNINAVTLEFDTLIKHINSTLNKPYNINFNMSQIKQQFESIGIEASNIGKILNSSMGMSSSSSGLDKMTVTTRAVKGELTAMSSVITKITSDMGQTVQTTEKFESELKDASMITKQIGETVTKTTTNYKQQREEVNKLNAEQEKIASIANEEYNKKLEMEKEYQILFERNAIIREQNEAKISAQASAKVAEEIAQRDRLKEKSISQGENSLVDRENMLLAEATSILNKKYSLEQQIIKANQEGNVPLSEELNLRKQAVELQLAQANRNLDNSSESTKTTLLQKELELKDGISLINTKIEGQEKLETEEVQRRIALYQQQKELQVQGMQQKYGSSINTAELQKATLAYKELGGAGITSLSELKAKTQEIDMSIQKMGADAKVSANELKEMENSSGVFGDVISHIGKMATMMVAASAIFGTINAIKEGINKVTELDSMITDLSMDMMGTNKNAFDSLTESSRQLTIALGSNISDINAMMKVYANANTTVDEIIKKTKSAAILTNISDMSASDSVDAIQSIMLQFDQFKESSDDVATQSTHISDVLASVAQNLSLNFKTGVSDISEAVKVSGEVINEAGLSYEKYASIVGKVAEISRLSGSTIGTAMKTIASRISRANSENVSAEEISKVDKAYQSIGISIRDDAGNFKDLDTTLTNLSNIWGNLNSVQRSYIAEQSSGVRQKAIFINMMNNYAKSTELATDAINSQGLANAKNDIYLTSIEAKVKVLSSTMSIMWQNMINSDVIKVGVDGITKLVEVFGNLPTIVGLATTALLVFKGNAIVAGITGIISYVSAMSELVVINGIAQTSSIALGTALEFLNGVFASNPIGFVAVALVGFVSAIKLAQSSQEDYNKSIEESYNKTQSNIDQIKDYKKEYEELANKTTLTRDEKMKLIDIEQQLKTKFGDTAKSIDLQNGSLKDNVNIMDELAKKEAERFITLNKINYEQAQRNLNKSTSVSMGYGSTTVGQNFNNISEAIKALEDGLKNSDGMSETVFNSMKEKLEGLYKIYDDSTNVVSKYEGYQKSLNRTIEDNTQKTKDNTDVKTENINKTANQAEALKDYSKWLDETQSELGTLNQAIDSVSKGQTLSVDEVLDLTQNYQELIPYIHQTAGGYTIEESALENLRLSKIQARETALQSEIDTARQTILSSKDRISAYISEVEAIQSLADAKMVTASMPVANLNTKPYGSSMPTDEYTQMANQAVEEQNKLKSQIEQYGALKDRMSALKVMLNDQTLGVKKTEEKETGKTSAEKQADDALIAKDRYFALNNELERYNSLLESNNTLQESSSEADKINLLKEEQNLLKEKQGILSQIADEQRRERDELKGALSQNGFEFTGEGDSSSMTNYQSIMDSKLADLNSHRQDKDKTYYNQLKSEYDGLEDSVKRFFELQNKEIPDSLKDWQSISTEIAKINSEIDKTNLNNLKTKFDKIIEGEEKSISNLEKQSELLKEDDYEKKLEIQADKQRSLNIEIDNTGRYLDGLRNTTALTSDGQTELNTEIDNATAKLTDYKIALENAKTAQTSLLISQAESGYTKSSSDIDYQKKLLEQNKAKSLINVNGDDKLSNQIELDTLKKTKLLDDQALSESYQELARLNAITPDTQAGWNELGKKISEVTNRIQDQAQAVYNDEKSMNDLLTTSIKAQIEKEKELAEAKLDAEQNDELVAIEKRKKEATERLKNVENEVSDIKSKSYDKDIQTFAKYLDGIDAEIKAIKDKASIEQESVIKTAMLKEASILESKRQYEIDKNNIQGVIDGYDTTIKALNEQADAQDEVNTRLEKQANLTKLQTELENIKKNKNVQTLKKQSDGSYQFEYTYDKDNYDSKNEEIKTATKELNEWESDKAREKQIKVLELAKETKEKELKILEEKFNDEQTIAEREYSKLSDKVNTYFDDLTNNVNVKYIGLRADLDTKYVDINTLTNQRLQELKGTFGTNLDEILKDVTSKTKDINKQIKDMTTAYDKAKALGKATIGTNNNTPVLTPSNSSNDNTNNSTTINTSSQSSTIPKYASSNDGSSTKPSVIDPYANKEESVQTAWIDPKTGNLSIVGENGGDATDWQRKEADEFTSKGYAKITDPEAIDELQDKVSKVSSYSDVEEWKALFSDIADEVIEPTDAEKQVAKKRIEEYEKYKNYVRPAYANGTMNAKGGLSEIDEEGIELRVLNNGDGITTAKITSNLNALGEYAPALIEKLKNFDIVSNLSNIFKPLVTPNFTQTNKSQPTVNHYTFSGDLTLPNVKNAQDFAKGLKDLAFLAVNN
jgi:TP901 family phage tail tape measure protein